MLSVKEFTDEMNKLGEIFPSVLNKHRMSRCYEKVKSLDHRSFKAIVAGMMDNYKASPLPMDFENEVIAFRRKNNVFNPNNSTIDVVPVKCLSCGDFGYLRVIDLVTNQEAVMRCNCESGEEILLEELPMWESSLTGIFRKTQCPIEWFMPSFYQDSDDKIIYSGIHQKMNEWKKRKEDSVVFWNELMKKFRS